MNRSESIKNLAIALSKFQGEVKNPENSKNASFLTKKGRRFSYSYATLDSVLNIVRPILAKNGLSIIQNPVAKNNCVTVTTILLHNSGEYIEFEPIVLPVAEPTAQGVGSAITYARRYALSSILGISSEDDDDGNIASRTIQAKQQTKKSQNNYSNTISDKQAKRLFAIANGNNEIVKEALKQAGVEHTKDIPKKDYDGICKYVQGLSKIQ